MTLTIGALTRKGIYRSMANAGLEHPYKNIWPYWASPTIGRFKEFAMSHPTKFAAYVKLIDGFLGYAKEQNITSKFTLQLPPLKALIAIDIVGLLKNEQAKKDIQKYCFKPTQGLINLMPLETINQNYMIQAQL